MTYFLPLICKRAQRDYLLVEDFEYESFYFPSKVKRLKMLYDPKQVWCAVTVQLGHLSRESWGVRRDVGQKQPLGNSTDSFSVEFFV